MVSSFLSFFLSSILHFYHFSFFPSFKFYFFLSFIHKFLFPSFTIFSFLFFFPPFTIFFPFAFYYPIKSELRETVSKQTEQIRKLKKTLKVYARKLKDGEGPFRRFQSLVSATSLSPTSAAEIAAELDRDEQESSGVMAAVKHQEREYLGMLEYNKVDESALIKNLIHDLQPYVAESMLPGLPAYIIFMCIRHTDHINDDEKVCSLLTGVVNGIKRVVKKSNNDVERMTLWLANACRLLHNLKQYSGEKVCNISFHVCC
ncbi:MYO5 [Acanthosepion pharaonis]|uniref:MYO5 n=1 Tax=Acanthosepion pharaonis TaxID=158019 RepID=A0A812D176_ACAPH|nr:MYO5 [Sepia pharaonis]